MAKYSHTKVLKKAQPRVSRSTGNALSWDIEVLCTHTRADGTTWSTSYNHQADVEYLNKAPGDFTKAELVEFMNSSFNDTIFDAHYEAHNTEPTDDVDDTFDINSLS